MGRGTYVIAALAAMFVLACQPLYGGKAEKMKNPEPKKPPPDAVTGPIEIKYVEDCPSDFRGDPKKIPPPQPGLAQNLVGEGDSALASSDKAKEPKEQVGLIKDAIDKYRNALVKDPYNVDATLKLALAYDRVLRKGCAITMLKRLSSLSNHPKWRPDANRAIDSVADNASWFKGYRKEATAAVGR